jgi:hypothetical protein
VVLQGTKPLELKLPQILARQTAEAKMPAFDNEPRHEEKYEPLLLERQIPDSSGCSAEITVSSCFSFQLLRMEEIMIHHELKAKESDDAYSMAKMIFRTSDQQSSSVFGQIADILHMLELWAEHIGLRIKPLVCKRGRKLKHEAAAELRTRRLDLGEDFSKHYFEIGERLEALQRTTSPEMPLVSFSAFSEW